MGKERRSPWSKKAALTVAITCFVVVVIAEVTALAVGVHGFWRGAVLGGGIAIVAVGGIALGMSVARPQQADLWLPSNDE